MNEGKFKCERCSHVWLSELKMVTCLKCNHLYVVWLNYEEMAKNYRSLNKTGLEQYAYGG